jgi:hypothetical protein
MMTINRVIAAAVLACVAGVWGVGGAGSAAADVITIGAAKDTTIYAVSGTLSNGSGPTMIAGRNSLGDSRRGLIAFDIAGQVPAGSVITAVHLTLHVSGLGTAPSAAVGLHRVLAEWGEGASHAGPSGGSGAPAENGDATWTHRLYPTTMWSSPGGDYLPAASAAQLLAATGSYTWSSAAMVAEVQSWLDTPTGNFGWMLIGDETLAGSARRFESRESASVLLRPALEIHYIPAPGWLGLGAAGALVAARRRR